MGRERGGSLVGLFDRLFGNGLLSLAEGDVDELAVLLRESKLLSEALDVLDGVGSGEENEEDGGRGVRLTEGRLKGEGDLREEIKSRAKRDMNVWFGWGGCWKVVRQSTLLKIHPRLVNVLLPEVLGNEAGDSLSEAIGPQGADDEQPAAVIVSQIEKPKELVIICKSKTKGRCERK